jgi:hypothetical protein
VDTERPPPNICAKAVYWPAPSPTIRSIIAARSPGLPGYNAAQVILADLGIKAVWMPPPIAARMSALIGS